jgi:hypothetical protein
MSLTLEGSISPRMMHWAILAANLSDVVIVVIRFVNYFLALEFPVLQFNLFTFVYACALFGCVKVLRCKYRQIIFGDKKGLYGNPKHVFIGVFFE